MLDDAEERRGVAGAEKIEVTLAHLAAGDVVLAGYFGDLFGGTTNLGGGLLTSAGGEDMFVAKYSGATGAYLWARQGGGSGDDEAAAVAVDGTGNVVVTGHFRNTADFSGRSLTSAGIDDVFVAKYSASGASLWAKSFGDADEQQGSAVGVDRDGNIVLAGNFSGSIDLGGGPLYNLAGGDIFLAKLSASGAPVWSFRFGNAGDANPELAKGLAVDGSGNVVLTGQILPSLNFGSGVLWNLTSTNDVFIAKFSPSGTNLWSKRAGSSGDDEGTGAAIDRNGNVLVVGDFFDAVDFGGGALTNPGNAPVGGSQDSFVDHDTAARDRGGSGATCATCSANRAGVLGGVRWPVALDANRLARYLPAPGAGPGTTSRIRHLEPCGRTSGVGMRRR